MDSFKNNIIDPAIELTEDGSSTLLHPIIGDHYHSTRGAVGESMHIYIEHGLKTIDKDQIDILEFGFGSGLNCYLTFKECAESPKIVRYTTIELYPISIDTIKRIDYATDPDYLTLHNAHWGNWVDITPTFALKKLNEDFKSVELESQSYDLVYFDAFAPDSQPDLWSPAIFTKIYNSLRPEGVLVSYSAKGVVKQALRDAGFKVYRKPGALGKHHMLRAVKE